MTSLLGRECERDGEQGLRDSGRSVWPENSLASSYGEEKLEEREALGGDRVTVRLESEAREVFGEESVRVGVMVGKKCEAMVATSIALLCGERERE